MLLWLRSTSTEMFKRPEGRGKGRSIFQGHNTYTYTKLICLCFLILTVNSTPRMAIIINTRDDTLLVPMAIHEITSVAAVLAVAFKPFNAQGTFIKLFSF